MSDVCDDWEKVYCWFVVDECDEDEDWLDGEDEEDWLGVVVGGTESSVSIGDSSVEEWVEGWVWNPLSDGYTCCGSDAAECVEDKEDWLEVVVGVS